MTYQTRRSRLYRAAAHATAGESAAARAVVAEAVANAPGLTTSFVDSQEHYRDETVKQRLIEVLVGAGLPSAEVVCQG